MSNHARKLNCSRARSQRKRDKRADKRREAKAYSKQTPKSQRRQSNIIFPKEWGGLFQSNRKARKTYVVTGEKAG